MKTFKTKSLSEEYTDEELKNLGAKLTSFISFERAVRQEANVAEKDILGYEVTEQGIIIIWK